MPEPGGRGIYYVNGQSSGSLTAYQVQSKDSRDIVSEEATLPNISRDGKRVVYTTVISGKGRELWVADIDGGNKLKIATAENMGGWQVGARQSSPFFCGARGANRGR
jgi:Tol biopolymer transport system component